jgi:hypothetical protein
VFPAQNLFFHRDGLCHIEYDLASVRFHVLRGLLGVWLGIRLCCFFFVCGLWVLVFVLDGESSCVDGDVHGSQEAWRSTELAFESLFWVDQVMVIVRYVR